MGDIQLLIAAYVFLRCLEVFARAESYWVSSAARGAVCIVAGLVACLAMLLAAVSLGLKR